MKREILDDYLIKDTFENSYPLKKYYLKYKQLIPVFILTGMLMLTLIEIKASNANNLEQSSYLSPSLKNYLALIFIVLNYLTFFLLRKFYKYILISTLLLGMFNVINFNFGEYRFFLSSGSTFGIQPFILLLTFLIIGLNYKKVKSFFSGESLSLEREQGIKILIEKEKIERFIEKYQSYTLEDLKLVLADKRFVHEAKEAAKQLIKLREEQNN